MSDISHKRDHVAGMYDGPKWKAKVRKMTDAQIVAIFFRDTQKQTKPQPKKESSDGTPF